MGYATGHRHEECIALTGAVALGVLVGALPGRQWLAVVVAAAVAASGTVLSSAQDWHPPGPLFLVFGFGAAASVPHSVADVPVAVAVAGATTAFALVVGNVGALLRHQRSVPIRLRPAWTRQPARNAVVVAVAASLATSVPLLALGLGPVETVLVVVVLQVLTEMVVGRNYGLALLFITPMALLMGQVAAPRPAVGLLLDRGVETVIGALVAIAVIGYDELRRRRTTSAA